MRLAADSGARRGELAGLRFGDLDGRVLHVTGRCQRTSSGHPSPAETGFVTLGASTAQLWRRPEFDWRSRTSRALGPWVFSAQVDHQVRITTGALGPRFARLRDAAGLPGASLHRLRHTVATFLVAHREILQAQARLGHADAATTQREYAYALPLTDRAVADTIDRHLDSIVVEHDTPAKHARTDDSRSR